MRKCFLCGAEYDETNRPEAFKVVSKKTDKVIGINVIDKCGNLSLCTNCVRAYGVGALSAIDVYCPWESDVKVVDIDFEYE